MSTGQKVGVNVVSVSNLIPWVVKEKTATNKSMLASKNLPKPVTKASEGQHWIRVLAAELALRLNEARESSPHLWPKTLVLHAKKGDVI